MLKRPQHEDFEFMVEEFGPPETLAPFDDARIEGSPVAYPTRFWRSGRLMACAGFGTAFCDFATRTSSGTWLRLWSETIRTSTRIAVTS